MAEFFQTVMGHRFYESTMPRIATALESLVETLGKQATPSPSIPPDPVVARIRRLVEHFDRSVPEGTDGSTVIDAVRKAMRDDIDYLKGTLAAWEEAQR